MLKILLTTTGNDPRSKLALRYLYSAIEGAPVKVSLIDPRQDAGEMILYDEIVRGKFDLIYMQCDSDNVRDVTRLMERVKRARPSSVIMCGGIEVTFDTREFMLEHPEIDYVIRGEEERVMFDFLKTVLSGALAFDSVNGLAYWNGNNVAVNRIAEPVRFDDIPFPYETIEPAQGETVYYESFRGTPDRCMYRRVLPDDYVRMRSIGNVCTELRYFVIKQAGVVNVLDKWFNCDVDRAFVIWEYLIENDNGITSFKFDVNGEFFNDETINLLKRARKGLFCFSMDIDSTNPEPLAAAGRNVNPYPALLNAEKLVSETDIDLTIRGKIGMPCETPELFARSFNKIYKLGADAVSYDVIRLEKGTALRERAMRYGYSFDSEPPHEVISSDHMSALDLIRIKQGIEIADIYGGEDFAVLISQIMEDTGIRPFELFFSLGEHIVRDGMMSDVRNSRDERYRALYRFSSGLYDDANITLKLLSLKELFREEITRPDSPVIPEQTN